MDLKIWPNDDEYVDGISNQFQPHSLSAFQQEIENAQRSQARDLPAAEVSGAVGWDRRTQPELMEHPKWVVCGGDVFFFKDSKRSPNDKNEAFKCKRLVTSNDVQS